MTYVDLHRARYGYAGLGAAVAASVSANAATDPDQTAAMIEAKSPSVDQIEADWRPAMEAASKFSFDPKSELSSGVAMQYMMEAMPAIIEATDILPPGSAELAMFAAGASPEFEALLRGGDAKPLATIAIKAGAAYGCYQLGLDPRIGTVTVEALKDGELTDKDFEAAGGVGGSIGGAAIASVIGIPPCIGGFVGGTVGKVAGSAIASAFKVGGGKAEREARRKEQMAREAAVRGQLNAMRGQFATMIDLSRGKWWSEFDRLIDGYSYQWQSLECTQAMTRFPLLWQNDGVEVSPYFRHPYNVSACTLPINRNLARGTGCLENGTLFPTINRGGECGRPYGCPYPALPNTGASDVWTDRVIQAFAAYDIWWQPGPSRSGIDKLWVDSLPRPDARPQSAKLIHDMRGEGYTQYLARRAKEKEGCRSHACRVNSDRDMGSAFEGYRSDLAFVAEQALSFEGINAAGMRISSDMVRTAAIYAAAQQVNAFRSVLIQGNLGRALGAQRRASDLILSSGTDLRRAAKTGRVLNTALNYGMLALGGAMLGGALMKGTRR